MKTLWMILAALLLTGTSAVADDYELLSSVSVSPQIGTLTYGAGGSVTYTVTVKRRSGTTRAFSATLSQTATLPAGAVVVSFVPPVVDFASSDVSKTSTLTLSTAATTSGGATSIKVKARTSTESTSGSGTLTVAKVPLTVTANDASKTYDGHEYSGGSGVDYSGFVLGETPAVLGGTLTFSSNDAVDAGSHALRPGGLTSKNYAISFVSGALTILPAPATVKANDRSKTYGSSIPSLYATVTGRAEEGDEIEYSLTTTATKFSSVAGGPYPITVTLGANPNYIVTATDGALTITARAATVKANNKSRAYGNANPALDATLTGHVTGGDPIDYTLATTATELSSVAGGPYPISVTLGANPNYSVTATDGALTVTRRSATVAANDKSRTYGGQNPALDATVTGEVAGGDAINYTLATTATPLSGVTSGPYAITVTLGANPNYNVTPDHGALTVVRAAATVKANDRGKTYGDANPALDATVTGEVPGGAAIQYSLATTATPLSPVAGGPYPITVTPGANPNYSVTATAGALTVTCRPVTVKANDKSKVYGNANPALDVTVTGEVPGGVAVSFALSTTAIQFSNAAGGPYPITVTLGANPNYCVTATAGALTISTRAVAVRANDKSKVYGDANPALDAVVTGEVPGGAPINYTLATAATQLSGVLGGPYAITVTLGANLNYSVTPTNGALTITPRAAAVSFGSRTKVYGDPNPPLTGTATGEVPGGAPIEVIVTTPAIQCSPVAGSPYPITATVTQNPNYNVTVNNGTLTITRRLATVSANGKSRPYGDPNPALDATVTNEAVGCEPVHYSLATTATNFSSVAGGPYPIAVTLGDNPNYDVSTSATSGALTVTARPATVTANSKSKTYGDPNPPLDATVTGEVEGKDAFNYRIGAMAGGDPINYTLSTTATQLSGVAGGPYPITVTLGANPNYIVTVTHGGLTIAPKLATVSANAKSKTYGDPNPELDAIVTGEVTGGDRVNYSLSTPAAQFSGVSGSPYAILVTLGNNPNYSVKVPASSGSLAIAPRVATVKANDKSKSYGDDNPALDATKTGEAGVGGDPLNYTLTTTATRLSGVVGSPYAITVALGANPNYSVTATNGGLTIDPRLATVSANGMSRPYGDPNAVLTATVTGEVLGGDPVNFTLSTPATQFSAVAGSPYPILVTLGANPNYSVKVPATSGAFAVTARVATVAAISKSRAYGDPNPALDAVVTGQAPAGGDPVNYALSTPATQFSAVAGSPYAITVTLGSNPNYSITVTHGTLAIAARVATVTANSKNKDYGDDNPVLDALVTGQAPAGGDVINYTLSTPATKFSGVAGSPYAITVALGANPNYSITVTHGALSIAAKLAMVSANARSKVYGDPNPLLDATVTGEVPGGDRINYGLSTTAVPCSPVAGSPYAILVTLGNNPNYSVKVPPTSGALVVTRRPVTLTVNDKTKIYGDPNPVLDVTVTGQAAGCDPVNYTLATTVGSLSGVAGSPYPITVVPGGNPNYDVTVVHGVLTIEPKLAMVSANAKSRAYGNLNPALDATVTGEVPGGDPVIYFLSTPATQFSAVVGSPYPILVTLGANPNYSVKVPATSGALAVTLRPVTVTANDKSKTYGDENPTLNATEAGWVAGGDPLNYILSTTAVRLSGVAGGPYPITVTPGANPNYNVGTANGELEVTGKLATVSANGRSRPYGDLNPVFTATVTGEVPGGDLVQYTLSTPATQFSAVAGSPYAIFVTLGANPNYSVKVPASSGALTITLRVATVAANSKSRIYGNPNPALDATVTGQAPAGGDAINYTLSTPATQFSAVAGSPYAITVALGSNPNYSVTATHGTMAIAARPAMVTANNKGKTYGDSNPALDATVLGQAAPGGDVINYTLATPATQLSGVAGSPYAITVTLGDNPNYNVSAAHGTLTIGARPATVSAHNKSKIYGDLNPALTASVTGQVMGGDAVNFGLATTVTQCSNVAGSPYAITVTPGANPNYIVTVTHGTLTIAARSVTVAVANKSKTYGDPNPLLDVTVTGLVPGDDAFNYSLGEAAGCDPVNYVLGTTATQCSGVAGSPYPIMVTLGANPNYSITVNQGTLTIVARTATVTANNKGKVYGVPNPALDATVTGQAPGCDPVNYTLSTAAAQFSGVLGSPYTIAVTLGANPNYSVFATNGTLSIATAIATVSANSKSKTYGDPNPVLDATETGEVPGGDPLDYTLSTTAGPLSGVAGNPYPITVTLGANPNYSVTPTHGAMAIATRPVTVTADVLAKVYGDDNSAALTYAITSGNLVGTDAFSGALTRAPGETVAGSPYSILQGTLTLGGNYALAYVGADFTITPATLTVTAKPQTKTYGDPDPPLDYVASGFKFTDTQATVLSGGLARSPGRGVVGSPYTIARGNLVSNTNYTISFIGAAMLVTARSIAIGADARSKTFGDSDPVLTYAITSGSLAYDDAFTGELSRVPGETVQGGPYAILQNTLALNQNYALSYTGANLLVTAAAATATLAFTPNPQQYSDVVQFTATVANGFRGGVQAASTITVRLGTKVMGTIALTPSGASLTGTLSAVLHEPGTGQWAPGLYAASGELDAVNPNFSLAQPASGILTIIPEDARTTYTGPFFASATARYEDDDDDDLKYRTANVTLSATIRDITATADAGGDESFGDIRNATVSFVDRDNGDAIIATVPVGLVSATDTKTGTASFNWSVNLGTADSKQLNVGVIVNGHYTRNSVVDNAVVEVIKPASDYIKGSGHLVLAGSAGDLAGDAGSRNDFSFEVKYNSSGSSLSGSISTTVRRGGRVYQIKGTTMRSLSVQPAATGGTATFVGKASVRDITNSNNPVTLDANAALQMTMGDAGTSGAADWIAIAAWKTGGGLWFSSNWDGTSTVQQSLGGGSLEVRGGTSRSVAQPAFARSTPSEVAGGALPLAFALPQNYPNPFTTSTNIRFELPERSRVTITIYDVTGREVANLVDGAVEPGAHLATWSGRTREGHPAGPGVYFVRMVAASLSGSAGYRSDRRLSLVK